MSFKRRVLSTLGKDLRLEIGRVLELKVTIGMGVDELRDALARSKRAKLNAIVCESLPRDTLKDNCVAVGIDDSGKEKAALVECILAAGGGKRANDIRYQIDPQTMKGSFPLGRRAARRRCESLAGRSHFMITIRIAQAALMPIVGHAS